MPMNWAPCPVNRNATLGLDRTGPVIRSSLSASCKNPARNSVCVLPDTTARYDSCARPAFAVRQMSLTGDVFGAASVSA